MTTEVENVIHHSFRDMEQSRWKYITENYIRKTVETIFTHISSIMFYESKNYGEAPYQLINWYYDTRYAALVAICATQIINFYKKEFTRLGNYTPGPSDARPNNVGVPSHHDDDDPPEP